MIGPNSIRVRGRNERSGTIRSFPPLASIANPPAGCSLTSTKSPAKFRSSKAIPSIPARVAATAPKVLPHSTR